MRYIMKKVYRIITSLVLALCMTVSLAGCFVPDDDGGDTPPSFQFVPLSTPSGLAFDADTYTLSWTGDANADGYIVYHNGAESETTATSLQIFLTTETNVFKVKAVGDGLDYVDSGWSQEYTYTVPAEQLSVYEKVNIKIAKDLEDRGYTLIKIIGISYASDTANWDGENITFQTISIVDGENANLMISYGCPAGKGLVETLADFDTAIYKGVDIEEIVDYDSALWFVDSGSYDGEMQNLKKQGYTISVLDSVVRKGVKFGSGFTFEIVMTCKAVRDDSVKYFTCKYRVDIINGSTIEKNNYLHKVLDYTLRDVTETSFVLHEEGTLSWPYIEGWVQAVESAS